jgi:hypothetical protein
MQSTLIGFYISIIIIGLLFAYGGYEETMRLFAYLDLQFRFTILKIRMHFMARKLKKGLNISTIKQKESTHG